MVIGLVALLVFAAVVSVVVGLGRRVPSAVESRVQEFRSRAGAVEEREMDLDIPFADRVLKPGVEAVARLFSSLLPASLLADVQRQLVMAGNPMTLNAFMVVWAICVAYMTGFILIATVVVSGKVGVQQAMVVVAFGGIGWMLPRIWLKGRVKARQKEVTKALPDALDMVTTCVEAGLGLDGALMRVAEKSKGPLADELSRMLREAAMGKLRREALTELGERVGVEELTGFINSVIQAEQLGVGVAQVLRVQSEQLRMRRRQRAEKAAHEAPVKMLFPLVLFILPTFMLVVIGPALIRIGQTLTR